MNPQTQNRLAALAIGAGTIAYLGIKKPWKKTESMTGPVPESKLPSPDLKGIKQEMQQNEKALGTTPVGLCFSSFSSFVLFMQENKFKEATGFYEPIVRKNFDR